MFEMPFYFKAKILSNFCVITTVSAKARVLVLPDVGLWGFSACDSLPCGPWFCSYFCPVGGVFALSKNSLGSI